MRLLIFSLIFCCCFIPQSTNAQSELEVLYYEVLIVFNLVKAWLYQQPTNNDRYKYDHSNGHTYNQEEYDFIIIGASPTGSAIANRLTENSDFKVLVLEAGKYENDFSDIPGMGQSLISSEMNWGYRTTPQEKSCLGIMEQRCSFPRGQALGGTTAINGMVYSRGTRNDYDSWKRLGNAGWGYDDLLPYFLKSENYKPGGDSINHGVGGPLDVEFSTPNSPFVQTFFDANKELGIDQIDYNTNFTEGASKLQFNKINGRRLTAYKAYLKSIRNRDNLHILTEALVLKILIESATKTAYGVKLILHGQIYEVLARKEVILSAGTINSPQLLMLSGVGPAQHLQKKGIDVIQDLPGVGQNLQDHVMFFGFAFRVNYFEPLTTLRQDVVNYLNGRGPLTMSANLQASSFIKVKTSSDQPDMEFHLIVPSGYLALVVPSGLNFEPEIYLKYLLQVFPPSSLICIPVLLRPKSRGQVTLDTSSPFDFALINPNYYSDPDDMETMYEAIQEAIRLINTKAFQNFGAKLIRYHLSACGLFPYLSKAYWMCTIQQLSLSSFHPAGTCKMGPIGDPGAVVDETLSVYGINNLRVADASIMPQLIGGHLAAPAYMIGEKTADVIKQKYFNI